MFFSYCIWTFVSVFQIFEEVVRMIWNPEFVPIFNTNYCPGRQEIPWEPNFKLLLFKLDQSSNYLLFKIRWKYKKYFRNIYQDFLFWNDFLRHWLKYPSLQDLFYDRFKRGPPEHAAPEPLVFFPQFYWKSPPSRGRLLYIQPVVGCRRSLGHLLRENMT